jgi:hypothetical protein
MGLDSADANGRKRSVEMGFRQPYNGSVILSIFHVPGVLSGREFKVRSVQCKMQNGRTPLTMLACSDRIQKTSGRFGD